MTDRMIPVPESSLRALALPAGHPDREKHYTAIAALVACLPEPEPTFTDEEALAFYRALVPDATFTRADAISAGRARLTRLAKAGWTAPKALCPPPSPAVIDSDCSACGASNAACLEGIDKGGRSCCLTCYRTDTHNQRTPPPSSALVEVVEAARKMGRWGSQRLEAAVAAYDEQEGTP